LSRHSRFKNIILPPSKENTTLVNTALKHQLRRESREVGSTKDIYSYAKTVNARAKVIYYKETKTKDSNNPACSHLPILALKLARHRAYNACE